MRRVLLPIILITICAARLAASPIPAADSAEVAGTNTPFLLSLLVSHGAGLYAMGQPKKAAPYLVASIAFVDVPLVVLGAGIIANGFWPELFQGTVLTVTEYVVQISLMSVLVAIPAVRFFECREVLASTTHSGRSH